MEIAILLFKDYETLDVFGPVEIFGRLTDIYTVKFYSLDGGIVKNNHGLSVVTEKLDDRVGDPHVLLIPGGWGTRVEIDNVQLLNQIKTISHASEYVLTVCTGSSLLAKTGLLDGRAATSNKIAYSWVTSISDAVLWQPKARWVVDGKYYTSSGVTAGMDMSLGFLSDRHGVEMARNVAREIEYVWIEDKDNDSFVAT